MVKKSVIFIIFISGFIFHPAKAADDPAVEEARSLSRLGMDLFKKGEYEWAYDKFLTAYKKIEKLNRKDIEAALIMNIGLSLWKLNRLVEAHDYFVKYLMISTNIEKNEMIKGHLKEIGEELGKTHSTIKIFAIPEDAEILMKDPFGIKKIQSNFETYVPFGVYTVTIKKEGFNDREEKIIVEKNKPILMEIRLEKAVVKEEKVVITSTVVGADILLDGKKIGKTPIAEFRATEGKHVAEVIKEGFEPFRMEFSVIQGSPVNMDAKLVSKTAKKTSEKKYDKMPVVQETAEKKTYWPSLYGWIGGGAGVVFLGLGVAMTVSAVGYRDKMNKIVDNMKPGDAVPPEYNSNKSKLESRATLSYVFYGLSAAAIGGSAAYLLLLPHGPQQVSIIPVIDRNDFSMQAAVRF
jgi:hypothetical protein